MRRPYFIALVILVLVALLAIAACIARIYAMDWVVQKINQKLQVTSFQIHEHDAPITSPFCYENLNIGGPEQTAVRIQKLCITNGLTSVFSENPSLSLQCYQVSGNLGWKALQQLKKLKEQNDANLDENIATISGKKLQLSLQIQNIDVQLGEPGREISWHAQNSNANFENGILTLKTTSPLSVDISRAPVAFGNIPELTLTASADLNQKMANLKLDAEPPVLLNTAIKDALVTTQFHGLSAEINAQKQLVVTLHDMQFASPAVPAMTNASVKQAKAIFDVDNLKEFFPNTLHIIEPSLTVNVPKFLNDPNVRSNPIINGLIQFWQQEAGAILGKAPKDSVRREDVKKQKPHIRKNPIPRQTLEKFRDTFANFQTKLKSLPTIDIQQGNVAFETSHAHFDMNEIALNTENLFKNQNDKQNFEVLNAENSLNTENNLPKSGTNTLPSPNAENLPKEPLQFQLAFNVRNAKAAFTLSFDGDTPFPAFAIDIENLAAADFLRLINMPIPEKNAGDVTLHLKAAITEENIAVEGNFALSNFAFFHEKISPNLIQNINAGASARASYNFDDDSLKIEPLALASGPVTATGFMHITNVRSNPVISFELSAQDIPCQAIPQAIPTGFLPTITDLQFAGTTISPKLSGKIPWKSPLTASLKESGFENRCIPTSVLPHTPEILNNSDYTFTTNYTYFTDAITVGPGTDSYVPLSQIPSYVKAAMYLTEDKRFFDHGPLRISFIERAIRLNLNQRSYVYGGSTISQQLTKNLFLTRTKNLARKLEEAFIAWYMETVVTKSRILELYINMIEFGPDVYGIKQAAHFYFDKTPSQLTPLEAAFLASLKVAPSKGARFYKTGFPNDGRWWNKRLKYIVNVLAENGYIAPAEVIAAHDWIPVFFQPTEPDDYRKIWLDNYTEYLREKAREKKRLEQEQLDEDSGLNEKNESVSTESDHVMP